MEIVTGYRGKEHITAYKTGDFQQGVVGREDYVLDVGSGLEVQLVSNNRLDIKDGSICMQGRHAVIHKNINDELIIENGAQGEKRIDLVVARYEKEVGSGVESIDTFVIKGTPSEEKPTVPECVTGDIRNGDLKHEMPLYEVELDGINVIEVRPVFKKIVNMQEIQKKIDELNSNTQKKINELNSNTQKKINELNSKLENSKSDLSNVKNTIITKTMNLAKGQNKIGDFVIPSGRSIVAITGTMKYGGAIFSLPMPMMEYAGGAYAEYGIELIYNNGSIFATSSSAWNNVTLRVVVWY